MKHGIYGYACRYQRGSSSIWSTHAWGIAIDLSSAEEYMGKSYSTTNYRFAPIFQSHGWNWGLSFSDPIIVVSLTSLVLPSGRGARTADLGYGCRMTRGALDAHPDGEAR